MADYKEKRGKRESMVGMWCTDEEYHWVDHEAEKEGISKGNYCRQVVLGQRRQAETPFSKLDQKVVANEGLSGRELKKVLQYDLPKIATNINQLAHHVNSEQQIAPKQMAEIEKCRKVLENMHNVIFDAIS